MPRSKKDAGQTDLPSKVVEDRKDIALQDPTSQEAILAKRKRDDDRLRDAVTAREQQLAEAADPGGGHENVLVVKQTEKAAKAEQERIDAGKAAAARQQPQPPPAPPQTEGWLPEDTNPQNPERPHLKPLPAGPMGEHTRYVTDDIEADGTPIVQGKLQGLAEPQPWLNGYTGQDLRDLDAGWQGPVTEPAGEVDEDGNLIPLVNTHSEAGARVDEIKMLRPVIYVPTEATKAAEEAGTEAKGVSTIKGEFGA